MTIVVLNANSSGRYTHTPYESYQGCAWQAAPGCGIWKFPMCSCATHSKSMHSAIATMKQSFWSAPLAPCAVGHPIPAPYRVTPLP